MSRTQYIEYQYMKSPASESIKIYPCFNLERLSRTFRLARPGISALERLLLERLSFKRELFMYEPNT